MTVQIDIGTLSDGTSAMIDLEELLATRLLVQGNSGSGKSHLLRRLLEQSAAWVQQVVVDPEGDFVSLADRFGHIVVDGDRSDDDLYRIAGRVRQHRTSAVLNLERCDIDSQMRAAAAFLNGLFDAERDLWYPILVVVDEAQLFAPAAAGDVSEEARKATLGAMANLMSRGRKRGLAGVIATQRLAKLAKNVAAEASNFLMGRTFLDIDMARAADLLGLERRQAEMFRDLGRGRFVALGPALSRRPIEIRIGAVETGARSTSPKLLPMPEAPPEDVHALIFKAVEAEPPMPRPTRPPPQPPQSTAELLAQLIRSRPDTPPVEEEADPMPQAERDAAIDAVLRDLVAEEDSAFRPISVLYQDFLVRCRIQRVGSRSAPALDLAGFRGRLAVARAGVDTDTAESPAWQHATGLSRELPEDMQGIFLLLVKAAMAGAPCPSDATIARAYGTQSVGRTRRLLSYMEQRSFIVCRAAGRGGHRIVTVPELGCETAPGDPNAPEEAPVAVKAASEPHAAADDSLAEGEDTDTAEISAE